MRSADAQAEAQEAFRELAGLDVGADQVCDHLDTQRITWNHKAWTGRLLHMPLAKTSCDKATYTSFVTTVLHVLSVQLYQGLGNQYLTGTLHVLGALICGHLDSICTQARPPADRVFLDLYF